MGHASTVVFEDVVVLRETAIAIICRIAGKTHALALGRLQPGSTVKYAGDHGVLVVTQDFAAERGIGGRPRARCAGVRRDSLLRTLRSLPGYRAYRPILLPTCYHGILSRTFHAPFHSASRRRSFASISTNTERGTVPSCLRNLRW